MVANAVPTAEGAVQVAMEELPLPCTAPGFSSWDLGGWES